MKIKLEHLPRLLRWAPFALIGLSVGFYLFDLWRAGIVAALLALVVNRVFKRRAAKLWLARHLTDATETDLRMIARQLDLQASSPKKTTAWGKATASNPTAGHGIRLLQLDSDYALEMMFCDVGIVDFWIAPEDLKAGRWERAWAATAGG